MDRYYQQQQFFGDRGFNREQQNRNMTMNPNNSYGFFDNRNLNFNHQSSFDNYYNQTGNQSQFNQQQNNHAGQSQQQFNQRAAASDNFYDDDIEPTYDFSTPNNSSNYNRINQHQQIHPQRSSDSPPIPINHISCTQRKKVLKKKWKQFINSTPNPNVNMKQWMKDEEKKMKTDPESARIAKNILRSQPRRWKRSLNVKRYGDNVFYYLDSDVVGGQKPFIKMTRAQRKILLKRWKDHVDTSKVINNQDNFMSWMQIEIEKIKQEPEPEKTPVQLRIEAKRMQRKLKRKEKLKNKQQPQAKQETNDEVLSSQSDSTQSDCEEFSQP